MKMFDQKPLTKAEWQDLFWYIHDMCQWNHESINLIKIELLNILTTYIQAELKFLYKHNQDNATLAEAYVQAWKRFVHLYNYVPLPFAPIQKYFQRPGHVSGGHTRALVVDNYIQLVQSQLMF